VWRPRVAVGEEYPDRYEVSLQDTFMKLMIGIRMAKRSHELLSVFFLMKFIAVYDL
jgi:hypothetical protein